MKTFWNKVYLLAFGLLLSLAVEAQIVQISENQETFIADLQQVMATGNNGVAIAAGKTFEKHWNSRFDAAQKSAMVSLARKMATNGFKMPHFYNMLSVIDYSITKAKYSDEQLLSLLQIWLKVFQTSDYKTGTGILDSFKDFIEKHTLYTSNYNRLYALGGTYSIRFLEKDTDYFTKTESQVAVADTSSKKNEASVFDSWDQPLNDNASVEVLDNKPFVKKQHPMISGLVIDLKDVDLVMATMSDSVVLQKTSGGVSLTKGIFVGEGGRMTWESMKMPQIYVDIKDFSFEIRNPRFLADETTLTYADELQKPIKGVFEFRGSRRPNGVANSYPRFMSYTEDAEMKNLHKSIEYKGGFSLVGKKIFSTAVSGGFSTIKVKKEGKVAFIATSKKFELSDSLIVSERVNFLGYIANDSIYHPAVKLHYNNKKQQLRLNKVDNGGFKETAYSDSYHQMYIKSDAMRWDFNTGKMDFYIVSAKSSVPTIIESYNFYDVKRLTELSSSAGFNPLIVAGNYLKNKSSNSFTLEELAQSINRKPEHLGGGVTSAVQQGFFDYNPIADVYTLNRKGKHFLTVFNGKSDYDDFLIPSFFNSNDSLFNATIDMKKDMALTVRGIKRFNLSDSLGIYFLPYDRTIQIKKNRTFAFNGQIKVRNYRFSGKDLEIDYDKFIVNLNKIDSITFTPRNVYLKGGRREIGGHIKYEKSGKLYLNDPSNKAGKKVLPQYPHLKIDQGVIVYFDEPARKDRRYNRKVFFEIPTIDYDSLNVLDMSFNGTFHSGGIFEPFKENLVVMPDTSIGFSHKVPKDIYKTFGENSFVKFNSKLAMDSKGLRSAGNINHLAATLDAKEIVFFTDSLLAKGQVGEIKETTNSNAYYPQVNLQDYTLKWIPKADSMIVATTKGNFSFYAGTSQLKGKLVVRTAGLFGIGKLTRTDSETASDQFKFNKEGFIADESQFNVKSSVANSKSVLLGKNVDVNFNVLSSIVNISTNSASGFNDTTKSSLEFPYAAYKTNIDRAEWNIKDKKISMRGDVATSIFTSTNAEQAGLSFNGNSAQYDIVAMTLNIGGVPYIKSADAKIIPDKGQVAVRRDAEMLAFKNARLTIDTLNGYHNLINGNIQILSKNKFSGDATYQFVNVRKDTFNIKMGNFELKELLADGSESKRTTKNEAQNLSTIARASVTEHDRVFLSPKILYKGDITMLAPIKNLSLDGFVIPELQKYPKLGGYWITYKGNKSEEITINVDKNLKSGTVPLVAGLHLRSTTSNNGLYPTFLSAKESPDDQNIFIADGVFSRNEPQKSFSIKPHEVIGNYYDLFDEKDILKLAGSFNLLSDKLAKNLRSVGVAEVRLDTTKLNMNTMTLYDFPVAPPILNSMASKIIKTNLDIGNNEAAIYYDTPEFIAKMAHIVGEKETEMYRTKEAREHTPMYRFSPKFNTSFVFTDLNLKWNPDFNSFYSVGKIGVSNIGENDINAKLDGYLEIIKNPLGGDEVYLFIEMAGDNWYYFGYKEGQMGIVSSDDAFNGLVSAKDKAKKSKDYEIIPVDFSEAFMFRRKFLEVYRGIKEDPKAKKPANPKKLVEVPTPKADEKKEEKKKDEKEGF